MAHLTEETVDYLAKLSRIAVSAQEKQSLLQDLQKILTYVDQLDEVDTEGVEPLSYVLKSPSQTPLRDDQVIQEITTQQLLQNAPQHVAQMIKVPTIVSKTKVKGAEESLK